MSARETYLADRIDRRKGKTDASARTLQVRELARATINCAVMNQDEDVRAEFMRASILHLRTLYGAGEGETEAVSLFGSLAWSASLQTKRVIAGAAAEQAFARLTRHDNDGDSE